MVIFKEKIWKFGFKILKILIKNLFGEFLIYVLKLRLWKKNNVICIYFVYCLNYDGCL